MSLNFKQFAAEGERFIKEVAGELGYPKDHNRAARVVKSILHTLRDMLRPEENVEILAQFPMFLKAVYVEGWSLKPKTARIHNVEQFIKAIRKYEGTSSLHDFKTDEEVEIAVSVIFMMLRKYLSLGEIEDIKAALPKELKPLFNQVLMV